jgi:DNA uptake protein ComE-like DNA-binding protein
MPEPTTSQRFVIAALAAGLCVVAGVRVWAHRPASAPASSSIQLQLDPDTASVDELAALPGLGEHAAQRIVTYRERAQKTGGARVFARPEDLEAVEGIGPRTVDELRPYLHLPATQP